jgi:hypothetical protein
MHQETSGTAEEKVPFECVALMDAPRNLDYLGPRSKAFLVISGYQQQFVEFYVNGGLKPYIQYNDHFLEIVTLDGFIARAQSGDL